MAAFDRIVESAAENLYGDERLRSNLTDDEAKILLDWALARVTASANGAKDEASAKVAAREELAHVRPVLTALDDLFEKPGPIMLGDAVAAVESGIQGPEPFTREQILTMVTALVQAAWQMREEKTSTNPRTSTGAGGTKDTKEGVQKM